MNYFIFFRGVDYTSALPHLRHLPPTSIMDVYCLYQYDLTDYKGPWCMMKIVVICVEMAIF
jgi:hypothetical protein